MSDEDRVLPFELERAGVRGRLARLDGALATILERHRYPAPVSELVAQAALLTVLVGQSVKLRWRLSFQIRGDGPVRLIATDYYAPEEEGAPARIRAYAGFDRGEVASRRGDAFAMLGTGVLGVTIDQGPGMSPYQGITPLTGGSLPGCLETYFAQSEQLATRFALVTSQVPQVGGTAWTTAGIMLQQLPEATPGPMPDAPSGEAGLMTAMDVAGTGDRAENWNRANLLLDTVEPEELVGPEPAAQEVVRRLFHEERARVWPAQPIRFGCTCSAERVEAALAQYSAKDISSMTDAEGMVTVDCQFCSARYRFPPGHLGFEAVPSPGRAGA